MNNGDGQQPAGKTILAVDDDPINRKVLCSYLNSMGHVALPAESGPEALTLLSKEVDLVLTDIIMPEMDGYELTRTIRADPQWDDIPVVMVTTLGDKEARLKAVQSGAIDYISKPLDKTELRIRVTATLAAKEKADEVRRYESDLTSLVEDRTLALRMALSQLQESSLDVVHRLCTAAESKDPESGLHLKRMSGFCVVLAAKLGFAEEDLDIIRHASLMHDIGKIAVPDAILMKPGPLDDEEWKLMRMHPSHGARILANPSNRLLEVAEQIARTHHERFDGTGYPAGLKGEDIPVLGRICAVADVFDALTTRRPYKPPFDDEKAFAIMSQGRGNHFDPAVLDAFFASIKEILEIRRLFLD